MMKAIQIIAFIILAHKKCRSGILKKLGGRLAGRDLKNAHQPLPNFPRYSKGDIPVTLLKTSLNAFTSA